MSEQVSHKSEWRKRHEAEQGPAPDDEHDSGEWIPYIPWLEARLSKMEKLEEAMICPMGIISVEAFSNGMDVINQAYADLMEERNALLAVVEDIERRASLYADSEGNPGPLADTWGWRVIAENLREAIAALPKHLRRTK